MVLLSEGHGEGQGKMRGTVKRQPRGPSCLHMNLSLTPKAWGKFPMGLEVVYMSSEPPSPMLLGGPWERVNGPAQLLFGQKLVTSGGHPWLLGQQRHCVGAADGWTALPSLQMPAGQCSQGHGPLCLNGSFFK